MLTGFGYDIRLNTDGLGHIVNRSYLFFIPWAGR